MVSLLGIGMVAFWILWALTSTWVAVRHNAHHTVAGWFGLVLDGAPVQPTYPHAIPVGNVDPIPAPSAWWLGA